MPDKNRQTETKPDLMQQPEAAADELAEQERLMQGIYPAASSAEAPTDDPNSAPAPVPAISAVVDAAAQVQDAANQIQQAAADTASQIEVAQKAAKQVSASAEQLHQAVQMISEKADQIQAVQETQAEAATAATEKPEPLTEKEIHTIVEKKVEEAITASTTAPAPTEPEKEISAPAAPITEETAQAIGTAIAAAITAVSTEAAPAQPESVSIASTIETPSINISVKPALQTPPSNGNGHAVKRLSKANSFLAAAIVVLSISFGFYGLYQGSHPQLPPAAKSQPTPITPMEPFTPPFFLDNPAEAPEDYDLIVKKQVDLLKARPVKLRLGKILAESEKVAQAIQNNIDQLKRKGSTDVQAVVKSFLFENVVEAIMNELPEDQKQTEGIRDLIKAELEKVSKYAEANFPGQK